MAATFDIGEAFSDSFRIWWRNLPAFMGITVIVAVPLAIIVAAVVFAVGFNVTTLFSPPDQGTSGWSANDANAWLFASYATLLALAFVFTIGTQIIAIPIVLATDSALAGRRWSVGQVLGQTFSHVPRVVLAALLVGLTVGLGCAACCVPGLFLLPALYVAVPALILERLGVFGALGRSFGLVLPKFFHVLLVAATLFAINMASGMVVAVLGVVHPVLEWIGSTVSNLLLVSLAPVTQTVLFCHLRLDKEGPGEGIAEVFD